MPSGTDKSQRMLLLGVITGAHGIKGDVLIRAYTDAPADIGAYGPLSDEAGEHSFTLRVRRVTRAGVVAAVEGIGDRTAAENLKGVQLYMPRDRLPPPGEEEFYHADLVGLAAVDPDGGAIGTVAAVRNHGAGDLLEIALAGSRRTELVPFTEAFVPDVRIAEGRVVVRLPELTEESDEPNDR